MNCITCHSCNAMAISSPAGNASSSGSPLDDCKPVSCRCCARFLLSTRTNSDPFAVLSLSGTVGVSGGVQLEALVHSLSAAVLVIGKLL